MAVCNSLKGVHGVKMEPEPVPGVVLLHRVRVPDDVAVESTTRRNSTGYLLKKRINLSFVQMIEHLGAPNVIKSATVKFLPPKGF